MKDPDSPARILWAAALISLPVTSFRWFPFLGETTYVRPLALYPLALLLPILMIQAIRRRRILAGGGSVILLGAFAAAVLAATSLGVLIDPIPLRGQDYFERAIRALVTLVIGLAFFLSAAWMNRSEAEVRFTFKWLMVGLALDLTWSALQAVTFYTGLLEKETVTHWQLAFSMRELVRTNRVSGLAYEPAWLAGQLATIYLPMLTAAAMTSTRLTRTKWLEPALLALSLLLLLATYSRGGIVIALAAGGMTVLFAGRAVLRAAWAWFFSGFRRKASAAIARVVLIAVVISGIMSTFAFLGQKNYFRRLWEVDAESLGEYIIDINAGARSAYSAGALAAFEEHPLSGVGLGASGFWIYKNLPDWSLTTVPEIAKQLEPRSHLYPNPKNLYVRLLAETGIVGFVLFVIFQFSVLADALDLLHREGWQQFLGMAGLFAWLAIALYNATQDSLATPNLWLIPGLLAGISPGGQNQEAA